MSTDKNKQDSAPSFEACLEQLEAIARALEDGELGLDESLGRYEQGVGLMRQCYQALERAERRIELLTGLDAEGNPITEPLDDNADAGADGDGDSLEAKAKKRGRRRSRRPSNDPAKGNDMDDADRLF